MAASERVQRILREVRGLDDDERAELETELLVQMLPAEARARLAELLDTRR